MEGHHLILGEIVDFITGVVLQDTHDERYRQKLAHLLVEKKGFRKSGVEPRRELIVTAGNKKAIVKVDFVVSIEREIGMIVKYGPGSLVTRRRPALAASRILTGRQIPVVVVTNGENAEILDGATGQIVSLGLESIPSESGLAQIVSSALFEIITLERLEKESRIIHAYEIDDSCPCDDTVCRL